MEVSIKGHGDVADEETALIGDLKSVASEFQEPIGFHGSERCDGVGEVFFNVDSVLFGFFGVIEFELAHDGHDDVTTDYVFIS